MHFDEIVEQTIERYAQMAQLDGWKHYVWGEIKRLNDAPHWSGKNVKERFLERVKSIQSDRANLHQL